MIALLAACADPPPGDPPRPTDTAGPSPGGPCWTWTDADGDGFGDPATGRPACDGVPFGGDCDDADPARFPTGPVRFVEISAAAGLQAFRHWDPVATPQACANEQMIGGAAVGDVDGDGLADVFLPRVGFPAALLRNAGDGTFVDVAAEAGVDRVGHPSGALLFDLEGDGDLDLYVTSLAGTGSRLYVNDGAGRFTDEAAARGVEQPPGEGCNMDFSAAAADVDGDGDLDLHHTTWQEERGRTNDRARLFLNDGSGRFTDATAAAGLDLSDRASFTSTFVDVDDDVDLDLLLAADWGRSALYRNDGAGRFTDATAAAGVGTDENGMGSAAGDPDGDGDVDWFVTSIHDETVPCPEQWGCSGNRLYLGDGGGRFVDGTDTAGVRDGQWGWGAAFFDYDLDGHEDLVQAAGIQLVEFLGETSRLWRGLGDGTFEDGACATGLVDPGQGRAVVPFDLEGDGDLDVLVVGNGEAPRLWRNDRALDHRWLVVALAQPGANPAGVGARVRVDDGRRVQTRWVQAGGTFLASGPIEAHFGLGDAEVVDVEVRWPDGEVTRFTAIPADQRFVAVRPD